MEYARRYLQGRIKRTEKQVESIKDKHGDNPGKTHTYYGGWDLGYYEGMLTAYHNILDKLDEHYK